MVSSAPGAVFSYTDPDVDWAKEEHRTLVFHPLNYSYIAYNDPFLAHEANMRALDHKLDVMVDDALHRLDRMVWDMEHKNDPRIITFLYGTEVTENEDGSFSFFAHGGGPSEYDKVLAAEYMKEYL